MLDVTLMNTASYEGASALGALKLVSHRTDSRRMGAAIRTLLVVGLAAGVAACASGRAATARPEPFPRAPRSAVEPAGSVPIAATAAAPDGLTAAGQPTPMTAAVLETALALRGTPYQFGGVDPATGFDCSGFVRYVFLQHAVDLPRTVIEQFQVGRDVASGGIAAGDLIFFTTVTAGASHVGIALDATTFVHAPGSGSVVRIERLDGPYWRARLIGVKRLLALSVAG